MLAPRRHSSSLLLLVLCPSAPAPICTGGSKRLLLCILPAYTPKASLCLFFHKKAFPNSIRQGGGWAGGDVWVHLVTHTQPIPAAYRLCPLPPSAAGLGLSLEVGSAEAARKGLLLRLQTAPLLRVVAVGSITRTLRAPPRAAASGELSPPPLCQSSGVFRQPSSFFCLENDVKTLSLNLKEISRSAWTS